MQTGGSGDVNITGLINKVFDALSSTGPINVTYLSANIAPNGSTSPAVRNPSTGKYDITITLDTDLINNGTKIAVAKTIFHESIHAYLTYIRRTDRANFVSPTGDYADLIAAWNVYNDLGYANHVYMAGLVKQVGFQLEKYAINNLGYPRDSSFYSSSNTTSQQFFEAVSWSGIGWIEDPLNPGSAINNPEFVNAYPNLIDRQGIFDIYTAENTGSSSGGVNPLISNSCN